MTSSTPCFAATVSSRSSPEPSAAGRPCRTTAARVTRSADCNVDPAVELIRVCRLPAVGQVDEELPVALGPGETGVYDAEHLPAPACRRRADVVEHAPPDLRIADNAFRGVGPTRLEL